MINIQEKLLIFILWSFTPIICIQDSKKLAESQPFLLKTDQKGLPNLFFIAFQDFQRLNDELSQQKEELQKQIALQNQEIENLREEIKDLRTELDRANRALDVEREKQNFQANLGGRNENQR